MVMVGDFCGTPWGVVVIKKAVLVNRPSTKPS